MKTNSKPMAKTPSNEARTEPNRRRLARLLKQILAGEITFASAAMMDSPFSQSFSRRTIE